MRRLEVPCSPNFDFCQFMVKPTQVRTTTCLKWHRKLVNMNPLVPVNVPKWNSPANMQVLALWIITFINSKYSLEDNVQISTFLLSISVSRLPRQNDDHNQPWSPWYLMVNRGGRPWCSLCVLVLHIVRYVEVFFLWYFLVGHSLW